MFALFWMVVFVSPQLIVITCESTPFRNFVIVVGATLFVLNTLPFDTSGVAPVMMIVCLFEIRSVWMRPYDVWARVMKGVTRSISKNANFFGTVVTLVGNTSILVSDIRLGARW